MRTSEWFGVLQDVVRQFLRRGWVESVEFTVYLDGKQYGVLLRVWQK